ncbi:spermatid nuclear transition protein 3-like [Microcebus murinus]|uniref:spermatid nuclear transition protein 3-like n=1 Tax=Microcebus murinus TaxID=30608 RepID=UPI00064314E5|nr:spermatid nuclear transition protein 3-like [Microcebus murinus]
MAKMTRRKPQASPGTGIKQRTANVKVGKKRKAPRQPRSRGSFKVPKVTRKAKGPLGGTWRRKTSPQMTTPSIKPKKRRGLTLFGHYHRLNEELSQNEPDQAPESRGGGSSTTSSVTLSSQ